jgi:hypothetical protein
MVAGGLEVDVVVPHMCGTMGLSMGYNGKFILKQCSITLMEL